MVTKKIEELINKLFEAEKRRRKKANINAVVSYNENSKNNYWKISHFGNDEIYIVGLRF